MMMMMGLTPGGGTLFWGTCKMQGAGKLVSLQCGENCGDAPRSLDAQTHTEAHAPRSGHFNDSR